MAQHSRLEPRQPLATADSAGRDRELVVDESATSQTAVDRLAQQIGQRQLRVLAATSIGQVLTKAPLMNHFATRTNQATLSTVRRLTAPIGSIRCGEVPDHCRISVPIDAPANARERLPAVKPFTIRTCLTSLARVKRSTIAAFKRKRR